MIENTPSFIVPCDVLVPTRHLVLCGQLRRLPVFDLVHGAVLLMAKRLYEASELNRADPSQVHTPFVAEHFERASLLSHK